LFCNSRSIEEDSQSDYSICNSMVVYDSL
jgi:hypothetical protein